MTDRERMIEVIKEWCLENHATVDTLADRLIEAGFGRVEKEQTYDVRIGNILITDIPGIDPKKLNHD